MDNSSKIPVNVNKLVELELNRQQIANKQIELSDKSDQRQYDFAIKQLETSNKQWNIAFGVVTVLVFVFVGFGLYFIATDKAEIGIGILTTIISSVFAYLAGVGVGKNSAK